MKKSIVATLILLSNGAYAAETLPLYPDGIPDSINAPDEESVRDPKEPFTFLLNTSRPTLTAYPLPQNTAVPAVVILPGGSYRGTSIVKEGHEVAAEFNKMGIAAFVLKYRTPNPKHMKNRTTAPLQDAQEALSMIRANATKWHVDPDRVGIVGFSAGGHLAITTAFRFDRPVLEKHRRDNLRPDFAVFLYPVVSMSDELTHSLSRTNLLGDAPTAESIREYSMELNVPDRAPPAFLMHAADDKTVKVDNTLRLFEALQAKGMSAELHIYPRGGHGFGVNNATTTDRWMDRCRNWLVSIDVLKNRQ